MPDVDTELLIVGAGPFGLAAAAHAADLGVDHVVVGRPMSFWREHMPVGMLLRSGADWHLDPADRFTIDRFLESRGQTAADVGPIPLDLYLDYAEWFRTSRGIEPRDTYVTQLDESDGRFTATLDDGSSMTANRVLLALGFAPFAHVPPELAAVVPELRSAHARDLVNPADYAGRRVLIIGGRQSAFESAALLAEAGADAVHVVHRHPTPAFTESDWSWVGPLLDRIAEDPGWYRGLPDDERDALNARFWEEGRLKLEPWLGPRLDHPAVTLHANTNITGATDLGDGLRVDLDSGAVVDVDCVVYATGYKVDLDRVELLRAGNLLERIEREEGFPVLDTSMQTTVPGLHITSLPAARDFGLFFAFTSSVRASAKIVGRSLTA